MKILKYIWKKWQALGKFIGGMIAFLLLFVLYIVVFAPFGMVMSFLAGRQRKLAKDSYWISHNTDLDTLYEQQF